MKHVKRAAPFIALVIAAVVIPVLATTLSGSEPDTAPDAASNVNLDLVILVNRMELTEEQMRTLHDTLVKIVDQQEGLRVALESKGTAFEAEMIAFRGTAEELDARLAAHQAEVATAFESFRDARIAAFEELGELLTYSQGVLLEQLLPRLDGALTGDIHAPIRTGDTDRGVWWLGLRGNALAGEDRPEGDRTSRARMDWEFGWAIPGALEGRARWRGTSPESDDETTPSDSSSDGTDGGRGLLLRVARRQARNAAGFWGAETPSARQGALPMLEELIHILKLKLGEA